MRRFWRSTGPEFDRRALLSEILDRNTRWIDTADAKAAAVLVFVPAVASVLLESIIRGSRGVVSTMLDQEDLGRLVVAVSCLLVVAAFIGAALWSLWQAFRAVTPRTQRGARRGDLFFGDIAAWDGAEWERRARRMTATSVEDDLIEQVHATARVAAAKHRHVRRAIAGTAPTVVFGLIAYALSLWIG